MPLTPDYGETPVEGDEWDALLPSIRELVEEPITKAAIYDLEQAVQEQIAGDRLIAVLDGSLGLDELLTDSFLRELHTQLYQDIWTWASFVSTREIDG